MKRFAPLLIAALLLASCGEEKPKPLSEPGEKLYVMQGKILSRDARANSLNVDHRAIPGFMEAMAMEYPVRGAQVATLPPTDSPKDTYDLAYGYILRREYALAEDTFRQFLRRFPNDRLSSDAQYWLGESLFQRQRYRDAAELFLNVSTKFETAAKAPDSLLRLGQSLAGLGEKDAACASLAEVGRKYPRASVSVKQGVEREQKRVRC